MTKVDPFNIYPDKYEQWFEKNPYAYQSELEAVKEMIPGQGCGLEIGVGSGRFAAPLGIGTGVEPSTEMRKIASSKGIKAIDGVAENLPFDNETFDFALMVTTICFLDDLEKAFIEVYRVLKPGGCLVIGFVDKNSPLGRKYQEKKEKSVFYRLAKFYSITEVIDNLKRSGFRKFEFRQTIFHNLDELNEIEPAREGFGDGSFIVIRASRED